MPETQRSSSQAQKISFVTNNLFIKEPVDNRVKIAPKVVVKIKSTAIGALPLCEELIDDQEKFIDSEKEVSTLAPQKHATYVKIIHPFLKGAEKGWKELCKLIHAIVQDFNNIDDSFVIYPYPKYCSEADQRHEAYLINKRERTQTN